MGENIEKPSSASSKPDNKPTSLKPPGGSNLKSEVTEEDEYDPLAHRPQENLNSDAAVFMHLFKATIGSGILFLPRAFKETGTVSAAACSILIGVLATYTAITTVRCSQILCKRARVPSLDLGQVARTSFQYGPENIRKYGNGFQLITNIMACFAEYQTVIIYILYVASSFQQIIEYFSAIVWDIRIYVLISTPFYCMISLVPNFRYLTPLSILGSLFLTVGFFVTLFYFFQDIESPLRLAMYTNFFAMPVYCTIFLFALHNMCILMPLENSMKTPDHLPFVLATSMSFSTCLYLSFGFFGYNKYIDACDTVIKNLPMDQLASQTVKIAITLSVMFGYGIHYIVPVSILWPKISTKVKEDKRRIYEIIFRIGGVILTVLVAVALPELGPLLGLFSALCFSTMTLLLPGIIELATKWEISKSNRILMTKNLLIFLVWIILLVIGCFESIKQIVRDYGKIKAQDSIC